MGEKMKKIFMVCSLCLLFAITSCGDAKPTGERLPDSEISDDDIVDVTPETSDEESADEETSDETTEDVENDDPDTTPEYDDEDIENDDFDTTPEYDDLDIELPECSASSETPCYDSSSGLIWSAKAEYEMEWLNYDPYTATATYPATAYCKELTEGAFTDWRLPKISELRTLIKNCSGTVMGGNCGLIDSCLGDWCDDDCYPCDYYEDGRYSKLGDIGRFWSSSTSLSSETPYLTDFIWCVNFNSGGFFIEQKEFTNNFVRCVR